MKRKPYDLECEQVIFPVNPDEFKSFFEVIIYMVLYTTGSLYMYIYYIYYYLNTYMVWLYIATVR